jgi:ribosomal protein S12 methylthiotransferase accessory factor
MLQHHRRNNAGGKGVSDAQAKASALGEALERYASMWDGSEYQIAASYEELGEQAVFPNDVMLFSDRQFAVRQNRGYSEQAYKRAVALPLPADMTIKWVKSWSVTHERPVYQPLAHAYFNYPHQPDSLYCIGDSNGNAAGTSLEDAVLQGFLELVERESVALWWYNRLQRPGIDLAGVNDAYIEALKAHYVGLQREFWVLDLTADFGIPACVALSRRTDGGPDEVVPGFGAHLDPRIAVTRALTEMNQLMPSALAQAERIDRRLPEEGDPATLNDLRAVEHPYLLPDPNQPLRRVDDFNMPDFKELYEEVSWCRAQVEAKGLEMLVLDLTRPDVGLPVVKVTVPGMRHFWRRLGPGRLYNVPVQMGWLTEPLEEEQINEVDLTG